MDAHFSGILGWKRNFCPVSRVRGLLCLAPFHFLHFIELLTEVCANQRTRSLIAENLTPPDADAYAVFLKSAPEYKVL